MGTTGTTGKLYSGHLYVKPEAGPGQWAPPQGHARALRALPSSAGLPLSVPASKMTAEGADC